MEALLRLGGIVTVLLAACAGHANTILTLTAPDPNNSLGVEYMSWTQSSAFTNVSISATFLDWSGNSSIPATGTAYLMDAVGPSATAANVIAGPIPISTSSATFTPVTLFTGLTLFADTYYLVISGDSNLDWASDFTAAVTLGSGVTQPAQPESYADDVNVNNAFFPSSVFTHPANDSFLMSVTGSPLTVAVPEPANWMFLVIPAGMLRRRRTLQFAKR
jgi:hypothetical protein